MPDWVTAGCQEYSKRLRGAFDLQIHELPLGQRGKSRSIEKAIRSEGDAMLNAIAERDTVVALDVKGKPWNTEQLSQHMEDWRMQGNNMTFLIGGPDGLDARCLQRADMCWSLSNLTLPHPAVRILLIEQLYRAWSILSNHPYHRQG